MINTAFRDESYGLTPELLSRMSVDKWLDGGFHAMTDEATWPIHDRVLGLQSSALTWLMNPTTLRRVYDNEWRVPEDEDALTLPELLKTINMAVWNELDADCPDGRDDRKPMISSLRRNLQREHMQRLLDLVLDTTSDTAAYKPISNLARMELRDLSKRIDASITKCGKKMDAYTRAHLTESKERIERALEAGYTYNTAKQQSPVRFFILGDETDETKQD